VEALLEDFHKGLDLATGKRELHVSRDRRLIFFTLHIFYYLSQSPGRDQRVSQLSVPFLSSLLKDSFPHTTLFRA